LYLGDTQSTFFASKAEIFGSYDYVKEGVHFPYLCRMHPFCKLILCGLFFLRISTESFPFDLRYA